MKTEECACSNFEQPPVWLYSSSNLLLRPVNLLTLNSPKTEFRLLIGRKQQLLKINSSCLNACHSARNLGFIFDEQLSFTEQIDTLSKSGYSHISQLRCTCIRPHLDFKNCQYHRVHLSRYCNSLYYNLPNSQLKRLQHIHAEPSCTCRRQSS